MARAFAEITFTPTVRAMQARMGSAEAYAPFLDEDAEAHDTLSEAEAQFITARDGFFQATVSEAGWPYVQFRGGPAGFLRVLDGRTLGYADLRGNRQYLSAGNLAADPRIALILVDYPNRRRLKVWGRAAIVDAADEPELVSRLSVEGQRVPAERAVLIRVDAFDWNCPQHIPRRFTREEFGAEADALRAEIGRLEAENRALRDALGDAS